MELDEMQSKWRQISQQIEQQRMISDQLVLDLLQQRYRSRFGKLWTMEWTGAILCICAALYILLHFHRLETWYLISFGMAMVFILTLLPLMVLRKILKMKNLEIATKTYKAMLVSFERKKKELMATQRLSILLCFPLAVSSLPVTVKILSGIDLFESSHVNSFWIATPILLILWYFLTRWSIKCYNRLTISAEEILMELDH